MIDVADVAFTYHGATEPALKGIGFHIERGEIFGFLGPNGAGKSTTQNILIGLLKEYRGSVSVLGRNLSDWGPDYYERVGVSFEQPNHYLKLTALENLSYFRSLYSGDTESPEALLEMVGLGNDGHLRVSQFSKGMRTRLSVARSLVHRPELLFLDEPTIGLDPVGAQRIKDLILQKRLDGTTVFLTTHDMKVADDLCDQVAFIVDGEIELIDAPRTLKLKHGRRTVRVEYRVDGALESVEYALDGLATDASFLETLRTRRIETIHTQETTLEQIFIDTTGRALS